MAFIDGSCSHRVKGLAAFDYADKSLIIHIDDGRGNSTQGKAGLNASLTHAVTQVFGSSDRNGTCPCLEREAVLKTARGGNQIHGPLCNEQIPRIFGQPGSAGTDFYWIADGINLHHIVNILLRNADRAAGILH